MKRFNLFALIVFLLGFLPSCMKYEEGPCISFRSKENRIEGEWMLKYWTVNGIDSLAYWNDYFGNECIFTFEKCKGDICVYSSNWGTDSNYYKVSGTYGKFSKNYLGPISFTQDSLSSAFPLWFMHDPKPRGTYIEWTILRLKYEELWFQMNVGGSVYELHLENIKKF